MLYIYNVCNNIYIFMYWTYADILIYIHTLNIECPFIFYIHIYLLFNVWIYRILNIYVYMSIYIYTYIRTTEIRQVFKTSQNEMKSTYIDNCDNLPHFNFKLWSGFIIKWVLHFISLTVCFYKLKVCGNPA